MTFSELISKLDGLDDFYLVVISIYHRKNLSLSDLPPSCRSHHWGAKYVFSRADPRALLKSIKTLGK
jgi:hypothetical protein